MQKEKTTAVNLVEVTADHDGQRVDNFLTARLKGVPRAAIYRMIRTGQVRINGSRCKPARRLSEGDQVRVPPARINDSGPVVISDRVKEQVRAAIVFENDDLLVVDKPNGMAVHGGSGLPWGLIDVVRALKPDEFVELAHRIDRETSGLVVLARSGAVLRHLAEQFRLGTVSKKYLCLLDGRLPEDRMRVDSAIERGLQDGEKHMLTGEQGKSSVTVFHCLQRLKEATYTEAELLTGRTHQIRVHAQSLGLPLAGDDKYSGSTPGIRDKFMKKWKKKGLKRLFLHAHYISLDNLNGESLEFTAPLPPALRRVLDSLEAADA